MCYIRLELGTDNELTVVMMALYVVKFTSGYTNAKHAVTNGHFDSFQLVPNVGLANKISSLETERSPETSQDQDVDTRPR